MKPFDLEKAKAGAPVVTRDGRTVTEVHLFETYIGHYPLVGIIDGMSHTFMRDGRSHTGGDNPCDLFMATTKKTVWANHYRYGGTGWTSLGFSYLFETEEAANDYHRRSRPNDGYHRIGGKAVAIEIEE